MATDRYDAATRGEDLGLGADEPEIRRFTRRSEFVDVDNNKENPSAESLGGPTEGDTNTQQGASNE
ncbi:hypothetical protein [Gordonia sp. CPCC 205333]|uniref:hypothetical protein n=1 Tax=Gordonia sp. CPCC 205333 TaxID=3140790 RepID=UPI003AF349B9